MGSASHKGRTVLSQRIAITPSPAANRMNVAIDSHPCHAIGTAPNLPWLRIALNQTVFLARFSVSGSTPPDF